MGTPSPPGGCPSGPGGVCKEGARPLTVARSPGQADLGGDRATRLSGSPRSRHCSPLVLQAPHRTPCTSRCHQGVPDSSDGFPHAPGSSLTSHPAPAAHKPSAQAQLLRNTPGKLRYGLFLSLPDFVGTLPYSLLTAGKTSAQSFVFCFFFKYIHIHIYTCVWGRMYMHVDGYAYTHTHTLA